MGAIAVAIAVAPVAGLAFGGRNHEAEHVRGAGLELPAELGISGKTALGVYGLLCAYTNPARVPRGV